MLVGAEQEHQRADAAQRGDDHERQRARREAVEHVDGVVVEHEDPGERDHARPRSPAPTARRRKYSTMSASAEPAGVPHQVDRGEVRAHRDREHAAEDRGGVDPARPRIAGLAARGDPARRDRAGHRAHAERARSPTTIANAAPKLRWLDVRVTSLRNAKLEPAEHDAERGERQRHEQRERDRRERLGERGPQHDEAEDEPDVVRLPHRADRVGDHRTRPRAPLGAAGEEVPEPGAEVGAAEERVRGDRRTTGSPRPRRSRHDRLASSRRRARAVRTAGVELRPAASPSRQRRLIWRSTRTSVTPSPT